MRAFAASAVKSACAILPGALARKPLEQERGIGAAEAERVRQRVFDGQRPLDVRRRSRDRTPGPGASRLMVGGTT